MRNRRLKLEKTSKSSSEENYYLVIGGAEIVNSRKTTD